MPLNEKPPQRETHALQRRAPPPPPLQLEKSLHSNKDPAKPKSELTRDFPGVQWVALCSHRRGVEHGFNPRLGN